MIMIKRYLDRLRIWKYLITSSSHQYFIVKKGQKEEYEILQIAHRIEKGLLQKNPKPRWGWEKIDRLQYLRDNTEDRFAKTLAQNVISAYAKKKLESQDLYEVEKAKTLEQLSEEIAGVLELTRADVSCDVESGKKLFLTRHSIREYDDRKVTKQDIENAIALANRCPSACNRQMFKVYVLDGDLRHQFFEEDVQGIYPPQFLIITSDLRAFIKEEFYDWIVSSSIFAGYLTLALHLYGVGSCCLRKPLFFELKSMQKIREYFNIPEEEQIVLEMAVGYYKEKFEVAQSPRKTPSDIVVFKKTS